MQKTKKTLNLIALIVFLMSNFLNPISYAIDDLDIGSEVDSSSEASQSDDSTVISNDGDKSSEQEYSETPMDSDVADAPQNDDNTVISNDSEKSSEGNETPIDSDVADAPQNDDNTVISNDSEKSSEGNETSMDSHVADAPQNDEKTGETSAIDTLKDLISNAIEKLPSETEKSEIDIARETLEGPITKSETFDDLGMVVKVKVLSGTFPKGTKPEITLIQGTEKENVEQQIIDDPDTDVTADAEMITFDIKFIYTLSNGSGVEVQPRDNTVQVTFEYKDNEELQQAEDDIQIFHINDKDQDGEKVETGEEVVEQIDINEQKSAKVENGLVIDAESFSYYTIVVQIREEAPESSTQTWQYGEDYFTISIAKPAGVTDAGPAGFTIMDRNLGATTGNIADENSYGNYYQWGNNYGFNYSLDNVPVATTGLTWDDSYNNMGYISKSWINGNNYNYDVWSGNGHYDGIWGGTGDNAGTNRGANQTNSAERQGPCPEGWHVPSAGEWGLLIKYWAVASGASFGDGGEGLYYLTEKIDNFKQYFKLPLGGYRIPADASFLSKGVYGYYWSSSPNSQASRKARSTDGQGASFFDRAFGLSVRCFKNEYVPDPETTNLVDTQAWVEGKDFETITISDPANPGSGFTIMDRNLGATTGNIASTGSYGFKYQWGNNYGFVDGCWTNGCTTDSVYSGATTTLATWNNIYNNHGYFGNKFIKSSTDYWQSSVYYDNLWGGGSDSQDNNWGLNDISSTATNRQGPCPVGYHVPSAGEWGLLVKYWRDNYATRTSLGGTAPLYTISNSTAWTEFMNYFKLPFAGSRDSSNASLNNQGSNGNYWSSSLYSAGSNYARNLYLNSSYVFANNRSNLANGDSVRCFKDEYVMPPITVTFDLSGGYWTESGTAYTQPRQITYNPDEDGNYIAGSLTDRKTPSKEPTGTTGWMFDGWYLSNGARWTGNVTSDMTVYAHWLPFEDLPIEGTDYIIMDRNLGATAAGTGCSNGDMSTCGYHFQWGNNYGFKPNSAGNATFPNGELTGADKATDVAGVVSTYYSPKFITYNPWDNNANYNLWGGSGDSILAEGVDTTEEARQGPCPGGYHVPSVKEWDNMPRDASSEGITAFLTNLKLPIAGVRYYGDTRVWSVDGGGYYWSSTPSGSNAYYLIITSSDIHLQQSYGGHSLGHSVRCFKNTPQIFTITLNANGGELEGESSLTTDNEGKVTLPRATREPNENGERVFEGWFASTGVSEKIGNSGDIITPTADMDVYAHWAQTISIWDPTNSLSGFTIMDRNLGAIMTGAGPEAKTGSYGFHYQWGNNYGFDANIDPSELTTSSVKVNVSGLTSYYSGTFITTNKTGDPRRQDTWMETDNNDLWNGDQIQGPCPDGWHIPSVEELDNLLIYWAKSNNVTWSSNHVKINSGHSKISDDLYIPYAGARNYDASFLNRGNLGIFWSYSINGSNGLPYDFFTTSTSNPKETYVRNYDGRIRGISVRCFRDEYVVQCPEGEEYVESEKKCFPSRAIIRDSLTNEIIQINDQKWDDLELYFLQSDGSTGHYTIMDRNMGATEVYNQDEDNPNFESLGYQYQWGNNYGFKPCEGNECSTFPGGETAGNIVIEKSVWEAYAPSKYARNTWSTAENWMGGAGDDDNLRGGAGDDQYTDGPGTGLDRQGPCPDEYHIPSAYEWAQMSNAWEDSTSLEYSFTKKVIFDSDFLLSFAGYRNFSDGKIYNRFISMYRTSSPYSDRDARKLNANPSPWVYNFDRSDGLLVRCMRNTNKSETLRIHANGGTNAVIAFTGSVSNGRFTSLGTPNRGTDTFDGWYDAQGNKLGVGSGVVSDIYARFGCESGYVDLMDGNGCIKSESFLITGYNLGIAISSLAGNSSNIEVFTWSGSMPSDSTQKINIAMSGIPVYAWYDTNSKTIYYHSDAEVIYMNKDISSMFSNFSNLKSVDLSRIDMSYVEKTYYMFNYCRKLENVNFGNFEGRNVTDMHEMFEYCEKLTSVDLGNFVGTSVTNMHGMFNFCYNLTSVNLNSLVGGESFKMDYMFSECKKLQTVDFGNFVGTGVTDMKHMFYNCISLTGIDLGSFVGTNVTNMESMFYYATGLISVDLGNFVGENVTKTSDMFMGCQNLKTVNLGNFVGPSVTTTQSMFESCKSLTNIDLGKFKGQNLTYAADMFYYCTSLTGLDLSNFVGTNLTNMQDFVVGCSNLETLDLSSLNPTNLTDTFRAFDGASKLKTIYVGPNFNPNNITSSNGMFDSATSIIGGNGTTYNSEYITGTRAKIDNENQTGYFTDPSHFAIRFKDLSGNEIATQWISTGGIATELSKSNATYTYYTSANKSEQYNFSTKLYAYSEVYAEMTCDSGYTEIDGECVQQFTVTLNASQNGGNIDEQGTKTVTVASGSTFDRSSYSGDKTGYTFVGWSESETGTGVLTSNPTITSDKIFYAVYSKNLTVTFTIQDTNAATQEGGTVSCTLWNADESCSITAPTLNANSGYAISGWNTNSGDTVSTLDSNTSISISSNVTYYSITRSDDKVLHITYTKGKGVEEIGKTEDSCTLTGTYNGAPQATWCTVTAPSITPKSGYENEIWTESGTENTVQEGQLITLTEDLHLTASAEYEASSTAHAYHITYNLNGEGIITGQKDTYTVEDTFTLVEPTRTGYEFIGWTGSNGNTPQTGVVILSGTTGDLTYNATWRLATYTLVINYLDQMSNNLAPKYSGDFDYLEEYSVVSPTIPCYTATPTIVSGIMPANDLSIMVRYIPVGPVIVTGSVAPAGYGILTVSGANVDNLGGGLIPIDDPSEPPLIGGGTEDSGTYYCGTPITQSGNKLLIGDVTVEATPIQDGQYDYAFDNWTLSDCGIEGNYQLLPNCRFTANFNRTYKEYTITYNLSGGTQIDPKTTYTVENTFTLVEPIRTGYEFIGWTGSNGDIPQTGVVIPVGTMGDLEFTANWEDDTTQTRREGCFQFRNLTDTTVKITDYSDGCSKENITIPDTIDRNGRVYTVTSIGNSAFKDKNLSGVVTLPSYLRTIVDEAFYNNPNMTSVTFPTTLTTIQYKAFYNCGLESVEIPDSVTSVTDRTFANNSRLKTVKIGKGLSVLRDGIFQNCTGIEYVDLGNLTNINRGNFNNTQITGLVIPDTVTFIAERAFENNSKLKTVKIGTGLTTLDSYVFNNCTGIESVDLGTLRTIKSNNFSGAQITGLIIPDTVKDIYDNAFANNSKLKTVKIGTGLKYLYNGTFHNCTGIESLDLGSLLTVGRDNFNNTQITGLVIPDTVINIYSRAFENNSKLKTVIIGTGLQYLSEETFANCTGIESVNLGNLLSIGANNFNSTQITGLVIPDTVTSIWTGAFADNIHLQSLILGNSVQNISKEAFVNSVITGVNLPNSLTTLGEDVFCTDNTSDPMSVIGFIGNNPSTSVTDLESQENTACFVIKKDKYNVKLSGANEGSDILVEVPYNTEFNLSAYTGTKSGWHFEGWAFDSVSTGALTDNPLVTGELVLYPIFSKTFLATFNPNESKLDGGNVSIQRTCKIYSAETSCTLQAPTITPNINTPVEIGFNTNANSTTNHANYDTGTEILTLNESVSGQQWYAITKSNDKILTINYEIGTGVAGIGKVSDSCTLTGTYNGVQQATSCTVLAPTITVKDGYNDNAKKWTDIETSQQVSVGATITLTEDKHYEASAQYQSSAAPIEYRITYHENGGSLPGAKTTYTVEESFQLINPIRENYIFAGWTGSNGEVPQTGVVISVGTTGDLEYYANWYEDFNHDGQNDADETKYTVIYKDGVDGVVIFADQETENILSGTITPAFVGTPTRENYVFSGWTPAVAEKVTSNATYFAQWKVDTNNNGVADEDETYALTINYVYSKGGTAADSHIEYVLKGAEYSVTSPSITNYQTTDTTVSGTMPGAPKTITVTYTPIHDTNNNDIADEEEIKYTLTIQYHDKKGNTVYDDYTGQYVAGAHYERESQPKEYYTITSGALISGTMPADNLTLTVVYEANLDANDNGIADQDETKYTLTIHYVNAKGGKLYDDYSGSYVSGAHYSITSPLRTYYKIQTGGEVISGVMGTGNIERTVVYLANNDTNGNGIADEEEQSPTPSGGGSSGGGGGGNKWNPKTQEKDIHGSADVNVDPIGDEGEKSEDTNSQDSNSSTNNVDGQNKSDSADSSNKDNSSQNGYSEEFNQAYSFAYSKGITTVSTIKAANLNSPLTRIQMAKMLSYFAINVLGKDPDTTKKVKFRDVSVAKDKQYDNGVTLAYQLGIMGINMKNDKFRPNDAVTRAEFVTALSRLLYNMSDGEYKGTSKYYEPHMKKLYNEGIITKTNPKMEENRGYVMIMLMRSAKGSVK